VTTYKEAGVDIDAANEGLKEIKKYAQSTYNKYTLSEIGGFGGCFNFDFNQYKNPVLVSSVDGVGTKLLIASLTGKHDTVGQCLVNHSVNDILAIGAKPLFFLDYFATGKLNNSILKDVVKGFSLACKENSCVLIGGETAEMPGFYDDNKYDVSGTIVGVVDKEDMLSSRQVESGDLLVGLKSTGLHTNGYSLARKVLLEHYKVDEYVDEIDSTIGDELLNIHKSYFPVLDGILKNKWLKSISHITGGGIVENTLRVVDEGFDIDVDWSAWEMSDIFKLIMDKGNVPIEDMRRTFNLGIGLILIINKNNLEELKSHLNSFNEQCIVMGNVIKK
tara:strand:- start:1684 stop:2682 length:999 start_codon:yes stop_codon:yes gene_type:complete